MIISNIMSETDGAVKVAVRERPLDNESVQNETSVISYHSVNSNIIVVDERPFPFDYTFDSSVTQSELYDVLINPLVQKTLEGFHCTALAYGQTGTGKTYTMGLDTDVFCSSSSAGVVPRALNNIFTFVKQSNLETITNLSVSFVEIYNEKLHDLLSENSLEEINIKVHKFAGGIKIPVQSAEEAHRVLIKGNKNRHVRPTNMNQQSSRSHAVFTIHVSTSYDTKKVSSALYLVDLAGSEGVRRTGHQGVALAEGVHINKGLLSIGKVLQALTTECNVIPYRDSVLSRVLQDSLNKNSYLTLLACISPLRKDLSETLSTLRFAQNAKSLKNCPQVNSILIELKKNKSRTPLKEQPLPQRWITAQINTPGTTGKTKLVNSNTFCTPNKIRKIELKRLNETDFGYTPKERAKKILNKIQTKSNVPNKFSCGSSENDFMYRDSLDSLSNFNASSSTSIDAPSNSFSPLQRYIASVETKIDNKIDKMQELLETIVEKHNAKAEDFVPLTPQMTTNTEKNPANSILLTIKEQLQCMVRQEISLLTTRKKSIEGSTNLRGNQIVDNSEKVQISKCKLFSGSSPDFKVPSVPVATRPIHNESSTIAEDTTFLQETNETVVHQPRRSLRLSMRRRTMDSFEAVRPIRRSTRLSMAKISQNVSKTPSKRSRRLSNSIKNSNKKHGRFRRVPTQNEVINAYFANNDTTCIEVPAKKGKSAQATHQAAVLQLLNTGSIKSIQVLPQIGMKTAYNIITHRTLHGKFKNFGQLSKLPFWRGKAWERFKEVNNIVHE